MLKVGDAFQYTSVHMRISCASMLDEDTCMSASCFSAALISGEQICPQTFKSARSLSNGGCCWNLVGSSRIVDKQTSFL